MGPNAANVLFAAVSASNMRVVTMGCITWGPQSLQRPLYCLKPVFATAPTVIEEGHMNNPSVNSGISKQYGKGAT
jgi:hypothetical protein